MEPKEIIFNSKSRKVRSVCSNCGNFFSEGEKVILCPVDDVPHHSSCWEKNRGCSKCTFRIKKKSSGGGKKSLFKKIVISLIVIITIFIGILAGLIYIICNEETETIPHPTPVRAKKTVTEEPEITFSPIPLPSPTEGVIAINTQVEMPSLPPTPVPLAEPSLPPEDLAPYKKDTPVPEIKKEPAVKKEPAETNIPKKAVEIALAQIGKPYVWETTGPDTFDCAGLCSYSYWIASGKTWNNWQGVFYVSDLLKLCNIHRDFSEIRPGDFLVRNNYQYLKPFDVRNEEGPEYDIYDTHATGWPYGESPVHDYGHIAIYAGEITYGGTSYTDAVVEARGKDWGVVICDIDDDGDGQIEWGNFFYRPKYMDNY